MAKLTQFLILFLATGVSAPLFGQALLTGTITDQATGDVLPFASIYVQETQSGSASNADGEFAVRLASGRNTVVFQYLGYQTLVKTVSGSQRLDIKLNSEALELGTVEVISGGEDISYSVIRRAIAKADYHLNQVEKYSAEVYVKGTGKVTKIGGAIRLLAGKEGREEIDEAIDRPFTSESTSTVYYERPNTYRQEVKQKYSIGDENFDATNYMFTTFYQPFVAGVIVSPLNPKAFGYYRFEQLGTFIDQDKLINKIKVIPRSKGEDVFTGTIYIVQDDWSIHSLDLTTPKTGFNIQIKQNYAEVLEHNWLPVTTSLNVTGGLLGIKVEYDYVSTISEYDIQLNPDLKGYVEVIDEKSQPEIAKRTKKKRDVSELEEALGNGEQIKRKDLRRLMKAYAKAEREEQEEPEVVSNRSFIDSNAVVISDSTAWAKVRPIPLTAEEIRGYEIADSIVTEQVVSMNADGEAPGAGLEVKVDTSSSQKKRFKPFRRQAIFPQPIFNPVSGYTLGFDVTYGNMLKSFGFKASPSYGFGWKRGALTGELFAGKSGSKVANAWRTEPKWSLKGGRALTQFNNDPVAIDPWISTYLNLFSGQNFISLYERAFGEVSYNKHYGDALHVNATIGYEYRRAWQNTTNANWFGLDDEEVYAANAPRHARLENVTQVNDAATIDVSLEWRPGLEYRINNGRKELIEDTAPTLGFRVRQGIPDVLNSTADFTEVQLSFERRFDIGRKGKAQLLARAGSFLNNSQVDFPDFRHFSGSEVSVVAADPLGSYRLLPYYEQSTNEEYVELYAHYQFRKFLLTQITAVHLFGLKEDLFVNYLHTPTSDNYVELGYTLDNIFRIFRLEFVTSYEDFRYSDLGVRIGVSTSLAGAVSFE